MQWFGRVFYVTLGTLGATAALVVLSRTPLLIRGVRDAKLQARLIEGLLQKPAALAVEEPSILRAELYDEVGAVWPPKGAFIIMVGTNQCQYCERAWQKWLAASALRGSNTAASAWYVSAGNEADAPLLPAPGFGSTRNLHILRVRNRHLFGATTGVRVVPLTFVFSSKSSLPCVVTGVPEDRQVESCASGRNPATTAFFVNASSREMLP